MELYGKEIRQGAKKICFGRNFKKFDPKKTVFHFFKQKLCLKVKINMPSVFPDLKYIDTGEQNITITFKMMKLEHKLYFYTRIPVSGHIDRFFWRQTVKNA